MIDSVKDLESDGSYKDEILKVTRRKDVGTTELDPKELYTDSFSVPIETTTTTTDTFEEITKSYTNYINPEQVTQKFDNPVLVYSKPIKYNDDDDWISHNSKNFKQNNDNEPIELDFVEIKDENENSDSIINEKIQKNKKTTIENFHKSKEIVNDDDDVFDTLPKDMKNVIFDLGLNKYENDKREKQTSKDIVPKFKKIVHPIIDAKSYSVFKPLSLEIKKGDDKSLSEDMKTFLKSFGLYPEDVRIQKSIRENYNPIGKATNDDEILEGNLNFLPEDLKLVLKDMGLLKGRERNDMHVTMHVFNPSNHSVPKSNEDLEKLNAILTSIKTTINKSKALTPEIQSEITEKVKELNTYKRDSENLTNINNQIKKMVWEKISETSKPRIARRVTKLIEGPDPLILTDENLLKTDVKRQDNTTLTSSSNDSGGENDNDSLTTLTPGTDTASDESETVTFQNTDLSSNATAEVDSNLEALKDSFGGGETAGDNADVDSSLPPKKPNGLYLLFDWNSFLEVGTEDDDRRVNLRFQPKVGDSRLFLPVTIP